MLKHALLVSTMMLTTPALAWDIGSPDTHSHQDMSRAELRGTSADNAAYREAHSQTARNVYARQRTENDQPNRSATSGPSTSTGRNSYHKAHELAAGTYYQRKAFGLALADHFTEMGPGGTIEQTLEGLTDRTARNRQKLDAIVRDAQRYERQLRQQSRHAVRSTKKEIKQSGGVISGPAVDAFEGYVEALERNLRVEVGPRGGIQIKSSQEAKKAKAEAVRAAQDRAREKGKGGGKNKK